MESEQIYIVVIDDHPLFARGLQLLLNSSTDERVRVAAWTDDPKEALNVVRRNRPQVAVIDLAMPSPGGIAVISEVKHHFPHVKVMALSGTDDGRLALEALEAGAAGFMQKSSAPEALIPPLVSLAFGLSVLPSSLLEGLLDAVARPGRAALERLSDDERQLWKLVAQGLDSTDIAQQLYVSERTAKRMVASLMRRIGACNRVEAAALAGRAGLLDELTGSS